MMKATWKTKIAEKNYEEFINEGLKNYEEFIDVESFIE